MYAYIDNFHLVINVFKSDLEEFFDKKVLYSLTDDSNQYLIRIMLDKNAKRDFVVKERAISQLRFPWDEYGNILPEFAEVIPFKEDYKILGYDLLLKKFKFKEYVDEYNTNNGRETSEPFWGRGIHGVLHNS